MNIPNLWGNFTDMDVNTPKEILEQQAKFLPSLTGDTVYAEVKDLETGELYDTFDEDAFEGFAYKFVLKSKFMDRYQFTILSLHHDIVIYPARIKLDRDTKEEIGGIAEYKIVYSEKEFIDFISEVFQSDRIKNVVGAMIKLSR
ncbi:hypothetical protein [Priestia megaterium]|uniref:hypothetical protein n=1 Tax=Priestia megaterium TaxID=1404 RepID=UPI000CA1E2EC|nr:hypothetical protein [Priestia megaterium]AUO12340.1 hypothetical protein C0569_13975 [Priestia megaterium]